METKRARKPRAKATCSRCKTIGHTIRSCPEALDGSINRSVPISGGISSRPQNSAEISSNANLVIREAPRVANELEDGEMDDSDDEMHEDELQAQEVDYLDAVLLDVVDENVAIPVEGDPFHIDNWVEEVIEDHRGRALRSYH